MQCPARCLEVCPRGPQGGRSGAEGFSPGLPLHAAREAVGRASRWGFSFLLWGGQRPLPGQCELRACPGGPLPVLRGPSGRSPPSCPERCSAAPWPPAVAGTLRVMLGGPFRCEAHGRSWSLGLAAGPAGRGPEGHEVALSPRGRGRPGKPSAAQARPRLLFPARPDRHAPARPGDGGCPVSRVLRPLGSPVSPHLRGKRGMRALGPRSPSVARVAGEGARPCLPPAHRGRGARPPRGDTEGCSRGPAGGAELQCYQLCSSVNVELLNTVPFGTVAVTPLGLRQQDAGRRDCEPRARAGWGDSRPWFGRPSREARSAT